MNEFKLNRFLEAQDKVYEQVLAELKQGNKTTHWMWFIFPQLEGLGHSSSARFYAIKNIEEANAYLAHPLLGKRLEECSELVLAMPKGALGDVFGFIDEIKLKSSMTLFAYSAGTDSIFESVLNKHFEGKHDEKSLQLIKSLQ